MSLDLASAPHADGSGDYLSNALALGNLIQAAYTMAKDPSVLNPPQPPNFPAGYRILANVIMKDFLPGFDESFWQFYGFLAIKTGTGEVSLVMRGTYSITEWIDDLWSIFPVPFFNYGHVGDAWAKIYHTMRTTPRDATLTSQEVSRMPPVSFAAQVAQVIREHVAESPVQASSITVDCAGHSLGAALITLYTLERRGEDASYPIRDFYTFASPLVGDPTFAAAFNRQGFTKYRIFNTSDPVPNLPPYVGFVPVDVAKSYNLDPNYYTWALCSHSMDTYMNILCPSKYAPSYYCNNLMAVESRAALGKTSGKAQRSIEVGSGATRITITVETGGKGCC